MLLKNRAAKSRIETLIWRLLLWHSAEPAENTKIMLRIVCLIGMDLVEKTFGDSEQAAIAAICDIANALEGKDNSNQLYNLMINDLRHARAKWPKDYPGPGTIPPQAMKRDVLRFLSMLCAAALYLDPDWREGDPIGNIDERVYAADRIAARLLTAEAANILKRHEPRQPLHDCLDWVADRMEEILAKEFMENPIANTFA